jgi:hypothetical protein
MVDRLPWCARPRTNGNPEGGVNDKGTVTTYDVEREALSSG